MMGHTCNPSTQRLWQEDYSLGQGQPELDKLNQTRLQCETFDQTILKKK